MHTRTHGLSTLNWQVGPACRGTSLEDLLGQQLLISSAAARDLIDFGSVYLDGRLERNWQRTLAGGEQVTINWPQGGVRRFYQIDPARILYRDRFLLAYNKEPGILSQPVPADAYNNLYAAVQRFLQKQSSKPYAALHHRLDQETSGVMVFAVDRASNRKLSDAFQARAVVKDYLAWVAGCPAQDHWIATDDISRKAGRYATVPTGQGKPAETVFQVLVREAEQTLVWARPKTGRTHQIRLHLAAGGHPVLGDRLYGKTPVPKLHLHAYRLRLDHPATGVPLLLTAPIPQDWPPPHTLDLPHDPA